VSLTTALSYLTILRMPRQRQYDLSRAVYWFPVVGMFIGGFLALSWWGLVHVLPTQVASLLVVVLWVWLTGGMHLDGLANTSEALLSWRSRSSMHEILSTPHIGALGMIAVITTLGAKVVAIQNLSSERVAIALFVAPIFGRSAQLLATAYSRYAKDSGIAVTAFGSGGRWWRVLVSILPLGFAFQLGWADGALVIVGWLVLHAVMLRRIRSLLGGSTGGTLGAMTEISESWVLVAATVVLPKLGWAQFDPLRYWPF
jgi:adenosylcobinamide-GDP ribazoletransferase